MPRRHQPKKKDEGNTLEYCRSIFVVESAEISRVSRILGPNFLLEKTHISSKTRTTHFCVFWPIGRKRLEIAW
jgi:hypothetical protein